MLTYNYKDQYGVILPHLKKSRKNVLHKTKHLLFDLYVLLLTFFCMILNKHIKFSAVITILKQPYFYSLFLLIGG